MPLDKIDSALIREMETLRQEGRAKPPERVIVDYIPPKDASGPRYKLRGHSGEFIRMNSNSYLSLSNHPRLEKAADAATKKFGVGPGAVRFIDGTYSFHVSLEERIAKFMGTKAAKIFNSAYTANCGLALAISNKATHWVGDQLNHNSIIRAMRIAGVPSGNKKIYNHNDMESLKKCLDEIPSGAERVVVIFDGIFSMRGDYAPIDRIQQIAGDFHDRFPGGVITVVDDSHGIGAYGATGRGTPEYSGAMPDVVIGTFGKAFGVNGGFIAASEAVVEAVRQKADTYIYTNPLSVADCAAALEAIDICDSEEGLELLARLEKRVAQFRSGLENLGYESIPGPHPVVPVLVRDTEKAHAMVDFLFEKGILVVGLTFPVVPRGDETLRFQLNAAHTEKDVDQVLKVLEKFKDLKGGSDA
jgi:glycine C-acetyltransferase